MDLYHFHIHFIIRKKCYKMTLAYLPPLTHTHAHTHTHTENSLGPIFIVVLHIIIIIIIIIIIVIHLFIHLFILLLLIFHNRFGRCSFFCRVCIIVNLPKSSELLYILVDYRNGVVWIVLIRPLISDFSYCFIFFESLELVSSLLSCSKVCLVL